MATQTVTPVPMIVSDKSALSEIKSFEDAIALLQSSGQTIANVSEEIGDGFRVLDNKAVLIGVPFVMLGYEFYKGTQGEFVSVHVVTKQSNQKAIINDGGAGIFKQCKELAAKGIRVGYVEGGLKESRFRYDENSKAVVKPGDAGYDSAKEASTFYFA